MSDKITWTNDRVKLGDLKPWEYNPRQSSKKQAARIAQSLNEFGQVETIAIGPDNDLYNGHQRLGAWLQEFGPGYEVDVRRCSRELTTEERQALIVMLHAGATGSWNWDLLADIDTDILQGFGFDEDLLKGLQTDTFALAEMLERDVAELLGGEAGKDTEAQISKSEELQKVWNVQPGQMFALGGHRLICGDCTDRATVERVMGGEKADTILTDPPYNVDKAIWDTNVLPMLKNAADIFPDYLDDKGICFWFSATRYIPETIRATSSLSYKWMFIWYPSNNMAHGDLGFQKFTAALVLSKGDKVWRENMQDLREYPIKITSEDPGHPTPKPIDLISYLVEMASKSIVFDPFLGSGTTLIACHNLNRRCRGIEIHPPYVAVTLQRFLDHTGIQPVLLSE